MLRSKQFWIGFVIGYLLLAFVPSVNVVSTFKRKG